MAGTTTPSTSAPFLSIVTCIHQADDGFLQESLASLEMQTFRDFEHIINIGQADESTMRILREYNERNSAKHPIHFMESEPRGVAHALNSAYPHARGKVIHFLHADDYYLHPDSLQTAMQYFQRDPSTVWITGVPLFDFGWLKLRVPSTSILRLSPAKVLSTMIWISHENTFMNTELLKTYSGFDEGVKGPVEYRLWLRMVRREKLTIVNDSFTSLRIHTNSTSRGTLSAVVRSLKECRRVVKEEAREHRAHQGMQAS